MTLPSSAAAPAATPPRSAPRSSARRPSASSGARARRHLPARRLHPDEGVGADRVRAQGGRGDVREARRQGRRAPSSTSAAANEWKDQVVKQMTGGVAGLFKANGVEWVKGTGRFKDANTIAVEGGEDVIFKQAIVATGSLPLRPPIDGLDSERCVDSTGLLAQSRGAAPARRARRRDHRLRVRLDLPPLRLRGDDRRDAADADPDGGRGRGEGAREAVRQARDRAPPREAVHEGRGDRRRADASTSATARRSRPT